MYLYETFETSKKQDLTPEIKGGFDKSNPYKSHGQEGFCFLSAPYFVRILSKFLGMRGF